MGYRTLIFAIIHRAVMDVKKGNMGMAIDAVRFFRGEYFEELAECVDLDIYATRDEIYKIFEERCKVWYWQANKDYRMKSKDVTFWHGLAQ